MRYETVIIFVIAGFFAGISGSAGKSAKKLTASGLFQFLGETREITIA